MAEPKELRIPRTERELVQHIKDVGADVAVFGGGPTLPADPLDAALGAMADVMASRQAPAPQGLEGQLRRAARTEAAGRDESTGQGAKKRVAEMNAEEREAMYDALLERDIENLSVIAEDLGFDGGEAA